MARMKSPPKQIHQSPMSPKTAAGWTVFWMTPNGFNASHNAGETTIATVLTMAKRVTTSVDKPRSSGGKTPNVPLRASQITMAPEPMTIQLWNRESITC